jgi:MFS family permease
VKGWLPRILLVSVLLQTAVYAIRPMVSYQALDLGAGEFELGAIASAYAVLSLVLAVPIGRWVDRWGEPRFVVVGSAVIALVALWLVWADSLLALAASQAALGMGHIMTVVGAQALIANRGDPRRRDTRFGMFTVVVSLGQLAGPAVGGLVAGSGLAGGSAGPSGGAQEGLGTGFVFAVAAGAAGLATLVGALLLRSDAPRRAYSAASLDVPTEDGPGDRVPAWTAMGQVLRIPSMPHAMAASLTVLTAIDLIAVYLPAYGETHGLSVETVGLLLATRAAASILSRLLMLPMIRTLGRRRLLVLSIVLPAAALAFVPFLDALPLLYAAMAVIGFGLGLGQPITLAWVADRAPDEIRGTALGVRLSGNRLGQTVLPSAVGAVAGVSGVAGVFVSLAVLLGVSAAAVLATPLAGSEPPP